MQEKNKIKLPKDTSNPKMPIKGQNSIQKSKKD